MDTQLRKWTQLTTLVLVAVLLAVPAGCAPGGSEVAPTATTGSDDVVLLVAGSGTTCAILGAMAPAFSADTPGYQLNVLPGAGTGGGVQGVVQRTVDVAAMARPPKEEEMAEGVEWTQFGLSPTAFYAHPSVGVSDLTASEITAIFFGEIENWSEVGGPDLPIVVYVRDEEDSSTKDLRSAIFGEEPFPSDASVSTSQSDMQERVAATEGAVGFGSWAAAVAEGADVRAIALDGVSPDDAGYQIAALVGIGYLSDRQADMQPLIDWLLSASGKAALRQVGVLIQ